MTWTRKTNTRVCGDVPPASSLFPSCCSFRVHRVCDSVSHSPEPCMCCATPTDAEALALRDSAQHRQGELRRNLRCISMGASRVILPQPSRGKRVAILITMIAILLGGLQVLCRTPRLLKTALVTACNACKQQGQSDEARATKSHNGSHPAMP